MEAFRELAGPGHELQNGKVLFEDRVSSDIDVATRHPLAMSREGQIQEQPSSSSNVYVYESLQDGRKQIRPFHMDPSDSLMDEITGRLSAVWTADKPVYTAISYAWGPSHAGGPHLDSYIICDGYKVRVTSNLKQALRRIRHLNAAQGHFVPSPSTKYEDRISHRPSLLVLWIDALCINQEDLLERARQVQIMPTIYGSCSALLVWLGELSQGPLGDRQYNLLRCTHEEPTDSEVLSKLECPTREIQEALQIAHLPFWIPCWRRRTRRIPSKTELISSMTDRAVLASILARPWFYRRWVVQEVQQGAYDLTHILVGEAVCRRTEFMKLTLRCKAQVPLLWPLAHFDLAAPSVLYFYEKSECSDPRDYIFALKGLWTEAMEIDVDYSEPIRDTYLKLVKRLALGIHVDKESAITEADHPFLLDADYSPENLARFLAVASCKKSAQHTSWESWVPDWRIKTRFESDLHKSTIENMTILSQSVRSQGPLGVLWTKLLVDYDGHHYLHHTGSLLKPLSDAANFKLDLLNRLCTYCRWREQIILTTLTNCPRPLEETDRVWLADMLCSTLPSTSSRKAETNLVAFVLRSGRATTLFRGKQLYRIHSCFSLELLPYHFPRGECSGPFHDAAASSNYTQIEKALASYGVLVDEEFYLE